jgi:hypothetical protein
VQALEPGGCCFRNVKLEKNNKTPFMAELSQLVSLSSRLITHRSYNMLQGNTDFTKHSILLTAQATLLHFAKAPLLNLEPRLLSLDPMKAPRLSAQTRLFRMRRKQSWGHQIPMYDPLQVRNLPRSALLVMEGFIQRLLHTPTVIKNREISRRESSSDVDDVNVGY